MISVKTSLAFVVAIALAIVAYLISSSGVAANIASFVPSFFILVTVIVLIAVTKLQNPAIKNTATSKKTQTVQTKVPQAPANESSSSGDTATLYVGNLAYKANEQIVQEFFETAGAVKSVRLVKDKRTGRRKGFGFIEVNGGDENKFIAKLNESEFMERNIIVRPANEKQH